MSERTLRVLNLGAGVQSSTVLLMACRGELEGLDAAVFADTGWEPQAVYRHLWWLAEQATAAGVPLYVATKGTSIRDDAIDPRHRFASLPVFVKSPGGRAEGRARRQCTKEYKIEPIGRTIRRDILGLAPGRSPRGVVVEQWFGISVDELQRVASPRVGYVRHRYPLIDLGMTRADCLGWLARNGYPRPPKSSCIGCPFHDDRFWRVLRDDSPEEFQDAAEFDREIRQGQGSIKARLSGEAFLHRTLIPLDQVDFRTPEERGQGALFDGQDYDGECDTGYCFI